MGMIHVTNARPGTAVVHTVRLPNHNNLLITSEHMNVAIACAELSAKLELPNEDIADRIRTPTAEECVTGNMLHDLIPLLGSDEAFIRLLKTTPEEFRQIDVRVHRQCGQRQRA